MRRLRTTASRGAAGTCLVLGLILAQRAATAPSEAYMVLVGVLALLAMLTAVKMWLHNCFESHLAASALVVATVVSTLLAVTVGIPGDGRADLTLVRVTDLVLSAVIAGLLVLDGRVRREYARRVRRPYAR